MNLILNFKRRRRTAKVHGWINDRRAELGLSPISRIPDGDMVSHRYCPIANAFAPRTASVTSLDTRLDLDYQTKVILHPDFVIAWIRDFDVNGYAAFGRKR